MRGYCVAGADDNTLPSASSFRESWQHGSDCLDTSLFQSKVLKVMALNAVQAAAWSADDKTKGDEGRLGIEARAVISDTSPEMAQAHHASSAMSGLMCVLVIVMSITIVCCIVCSIRMFEKMTTSTLPLASTAGKGERQTGSAASLGPEQRRQPPPASYRSTAPSSMASMATTPRRVKSSRVQAGKALSTKIKSNGSSGAWPLGTDSAHVKPDVTPHSSLNVYAGQQSARQKAGGSFFTVPVDSLSDMNSTGKGSFIIKDSFSSSVLRAAVPQNPDGSRKVQIFMGEDATTPCASVEPPVPESQAMEIRGVNNVQLGSLTLQGTGSFVVHAQAQPELVINGNDVDLDLHVFSRDGRPKATVTCKEGHPGGPEQIEIHVLPGTDSVLIVACVLAILFLCGDS